jgi:hypothetical protein
VNRTGVFASPEEIERLRRLLDHPYIVGAGGKTDGARGSKHIG